MGGPDPGLPRQHRRGNLPGRGVVIAQVQAIAIVITGALMIALDLAVYRTQLGRRLRATAEVLRVFNVDRGLLFGVILALVVILRPEGILALRFGEPWAARVRRSIHRTAPRFESPPGGTS